jgi:hypothetical protein
MKAEGKIDESREFVENFEEARSPLPGGKAAWTYLCDQQAQSALQGASRLSLARAHCVSAMRLDRDLKTAQLARFFIACKPPMIASCPGERLI